MKLIRIVLLTFFAAIAWAQQSPPAVIAQICGEGDKAWEAITNLDEDLVGILGELQQPVDKAAIELTSS